MHDTTEQEKEERERRLFVSNVSHELRTPLTSVKSYLEALDEGALSEPVAPDFYQGVSRRNQPYDADGDRPSPSFSN